MPGKLQQLKTKAKRGGWPWKIDHPNDERALLNGCYPDFAAAERVRKFFQTFLVLPKIGGGTQQFNLLDWWYRDVIAPLFGWKKKDGRRRFDKGFITTAKKSGKSTVLAGLPLYMILADGEEEAEAYAAATDRDQASIVFRKTLRSVRLSPHLGKVVRAVESQKRIHHDGSGSLFEAISSDADSAEGKNPHLLIADEVHVWRDRQFFNSLMYGDIVRTQPMFLMITTAGDDCETVGFEEYEFAKQLLDPNDDFYSESHFAYIAEAGPQYEWDDPEAWLAAQPSLRGEVDKARPREDDDPPAEPIVIGNVDKLAAKCEEAKKSPRKKREFIRYICNRWVAEVQDSWLDFDQWKTCGGPIPLHIGDICFGALDLSATRDLSSLCLAFPGDECIDLVWTFWTPGSRVKDHEDDWRVPLRDWIEDGWVVASGDNAIDYADIRQAVSGVICDANGQVVERDDSCVASEYQLQCLAYDPWNASTLVKQQLEDADGIPCEPMRQGYQSMNAPSKELERMIAEGTLRHGDNPVVDWMVRHCVVDQDPAGNIKPNKKKSRHKIDGLVAAVMAVGIMQAKGEVMWSAAEHGI